MDINSLTEGFKGIQLERGRVHSKGRIRVDKGRQDMREERERQEKLDRELEELRRQLEEQRKKQVKPVPTRKRKHTGDSEFSDDDHSETTRHVQDIDIAGRLV
jgi:hypothetical protein